MVRNCGPEEPVMRALVQGAYSSDWVRMNMARKVSQHGGDLISSCRAWGPRLFEGGGRSACRSSIVMHTGQWPTWHAAARQA